MTTTTTANTLQQAIENLTEEVDRLDTKMNELATTMNEVVQKKETTVADVQFLATQWATKGQERVLRYQELHRLINQRDRQP